MNQNFRPISPISNIKTIKSSIAFLIAFIVLMTLYMAFGTKSAEAMPSTFYVTNTNDAGPGSLRQAVIDANSNSNPSEQDLINFNIAGGGDKLIQPQTGIEITESVIINGLTQPGSIANTQPWPEAMDITLRIEIDNSISGPLKVRGNNIEIKGLVLNQSLTSDLEVVDSENFQLSSCFLGTDITGNTGKNNSSNSGVTPQLVLKGVRNSAIGGTNPTQRNIISYSKNSLINIAKSSALESQNITVNGNNIGIGADSLTSDFVLEGTGPGIKIQDNSSNITVGGLNTGDGNTIINARSNSSGIMVVNQANNILIAKNTIQLNLIGITIKDDSQNIAVMQNNIFLNSVLGFDLRGNMIVDNNDINDVDTGPNGGLNSPGYTQITESGGNTEIDFNLDAPAGDYRIEFYSNSREQGQRMHEGEKYLGFVNITSDGSGIQNFTHTLAGTGLSNITLSATEIDPSTISGFGATSEFGSNATSSSEQGSDIALRMSLQNPENYAIGNTLNYQITYINNGPNPVDLSTRNDPNPMNAHNLMQILIPVGQTYVGSSSNLSCLYFGDGSASFAGTVFANHSTLGFGSCGYNGSGSPILNSGDSITFSLYTSVTNLSDPNFKAYTIADPVFDDIDKTYMYDAYSSGQDIVDLMIYQPTNNLGIATSTPTDISVQKSIMPNQDIAVGANLNYSITITNNGASDFNPTQFDLSGGNPFYTALFFDALPENLNFISVSNPDIICNNIGRIGNLNAGIIFADINEYNGILCGYFGSDTSLTPGESISTTLTASITSIPTEFTNYISSITSDINDPDFLRISSPIYHLHSLTSATITQQINNVSSATYNSSTYDQDGDGIADITEDSNAPNQDGNGDGIPDRQQANVSSIFNSITQQYTTRKIPTNNATKLAN